MKKKFKKRILSAIMAASIVFSQMPVGEVFAAEETKVEQNEQKENEDATVSEQNTQEETVESKEDVTGKATEDNVVDTEEERQDSSVPTEEATGAQENEVAEEIQQDEKTLLNYIFVEKSYVTTPDVQNIMASIGTDSTVLESALLQYRNIETGEELTTSAAEILGNTVLFTISHENQEEAGYELVGMTYVIEGKEYTIDFFDAGMEIRYGVNKEVETTPDEVIVNDEGASEVEANVVTIGEDGQALSEQDIQQALENSESSVPMSSAMDEIKNAKKSSNGNLIVVLDPGHDSTHAGTHQNGCSEENMVLKIAQYCKAELEKYSGVTVYMTRDGQSCPNGGSSVNSTTCNARRVEFAASKNADVYVSFHLNASSSSSANGAGVYYPNSNYRPDLGQEGKELAQKIFEKLNALGLNSWAGGTLIHNSEDNTLYPDGSLADYLGIIRRCKEAGIPAVLIEHAFVTNNSDKNNFLSSDEKLQKLGIADATAIAECYGLQRESSTIYNGIDYKNVFNYNYYINKYSDIRGIYGNNVAGALAHFVEHGMSEGRQGSAEFDVNSYKNQYVDLRATYGNDLKSYYLHYALYGKAEGRKGTGCTSLQGVITVYKGVDYSAVYDYNYYISHNADIKKIYGEDDIGALEHFVIFGMGEGRQAKESFDVRSYRNQYQDLRGCFGRNLKLYYMHYIENGRREGRKTTGVNTIQNPLTVYNGVDYSAVYDYNYYISHNADMKKAYSEDDIGALEHFVIFGMGEGRQAKESFDVRSYRNQYQDLRGCFGRNLKPYYIHYIENGKREGRKATGVSAIQNPLTIYNGVDYSAVYDYNYYISHNVDMKNAYSEDDIGALEHFVIFGMGEGRQGSAAFNVNYYRSNYVDLDGCFGNNLKAYYVHYINSGKKEGRTADKQLYTNIMGISQTSVRQMMAYYNANASYPSYYNSSDAPNLQTFCQIYYDECKVEGIRAEVAFAQAMKETNFLRYGGDVKIEQFNFCGMGAIGNGNPGNSFHNVREGVRAQVQHLKAYASTEPLKNTCVDPRFKYVTRGTAPYVEWLGINENPNGTGWATDKNYGYNLKSRIGKLLTY